MRLFQILPLTLVIGCGDASPQASLEALCHATQEDRDRAAATVATEGTDNVVLAVQPLIAKTDAACR